MLIDGDALAREVVARGTPGLAQVVEAFGADLLTPRATSIAPRWAGSCSPTSPPAAAWRRSPTR